jgi:type 1 fimbria pilin
MSDEDQEKRTDVANHACQGVAKMFNMAARAFDDPGEIATLAMSITVVGITATAAYLTKKGKVGNADDDEILFTCLFVANSCAFSDAGSAMVEFNFTNIIKTLEQFQTMTGKSFEDKLNTSLLECVNAERNKAATAFHDEMTKFLPQ